MMTWKKSLLAALAVLTFSSCTQNSKPVVSLVLGTRISVWDEQIYVDVSRECAAYPDVTFLLQDESKDDREEAEQIEKAVARGVDAIIINPVSASDVLVPAIEKAFNSGVHVIIVGQKPDTYKYDAYLGVDNRKIGRLAASFIASEMGGEGNLLTVSVADNDASYYNERKHSFDNTIAMFDGIKVSDCPVRIWTASAAHDAIDSVAAIPGTVAPDMIFAYGDDLAMGVLESGIWPGVPVMGVDGMLDAGLAEIQKGNLYASIMNRTRGADAVDAAVNIIEGHPYQKNDILAPGIITAENVNSVIAGLKNEEKYKKMVDAMYAEYGRMSPMVKVLAIATTILAILAFMLTITVAHLRNGTKNCRNLSESYQTLQTEYEVSEASRRSLEEDRKGLLEALLEKSKREGSQEFSSPVDESAFLSKFKNYLEENLANSELSMDDIASSMNLSKAQMYRKVRAVSEMTPNELLQNMRLSKADELLKSSELTIAEVAYSVGFTSPSYFTRCYKDKYGVTPKNQR